MSDSAAQKYWKHNSKACFDQRSGWSSFRGWDTEHQFDKHEFENQRELLHSWSDWRSDEGDQYQEHQFS